MKKKVKHYLTPGQQKRSFRYCIYGEYGHGEYQFSGAVAKITRLCYTIKSFERKGHNVYEL